MKDAKKYARILNIQIEYYITKNETLGRTTWYKGRKGEEWQLIVATLNQNVSQG